MCCIPSEQPQKQQQNWSYSMDVPIKKQTHKTTLEIITDYLATWWK